MITPMAAILGKGGVGKTFLTAHLAMAFSYSGSRTLVVGCDQKRDTQRALCDTTRPSVMEALEQHGFDYGALDPAEVLAPASQYVDVVELGPAPLLMSDYSAVYDQAFHYFDVHHLQDRYAQVLFDVNEERFDSSQVPLLRRATAAIAVTDESLESLFVLNRLLRAILIGGYEFEFPTRVLGVVNNRSTDPRVFERFLERTKCYPLMTIPAYGELAALRPAHRTVFALQNPPRHLDQLIDGFLKIGQLIQAEPFLLEAIMPLEDADVWTLADGLAAGN
jgi:nitrogenase subunit NifH